MRQLHSDCRQYLNENITHEIQTYLALNFKADINLVIPECYDYLEQWTFGLYEEIMGSKVYIKDFKEIEKYIKNVTQHRFCKRAGEVLRINIFAKFEVRFFD